VVAIVNDGNGNARDLLFDTAIPTTRLENRPVPRYGQTSRRFTRPYYPTDRSNLPCNAVIETPTLRENADTYEQFTLDFFLPRCASAQVGPNMLPVLAALASSPTHCPRAARVANA
jgi:hypothetical protein